TGALLAVLVLSVGVFAGIQIQKHYGSTSRSGLPSGLGAAFAGGGAPTGATAAGGLGQGTGASANRGNFVTGEVAFIKGSTLYVTDQSGSTVKVTTKPATSVSKTSTAKLKAIHPGDTVTVIGTKA